MMKIKLVIWTQTLFRWSIAALFIYFGYQAVTEPMLQAQQWINPDIYTKIIEFIDIELFMRLFGLLQIIVAILMIVGKFLKVVMALAVALLLGIIINLGFNEITYRDAVILAGALYLWIQEF